MLLIVLCAIKHVCPHTKSWFKSRKCLF